MLDDRVITPGTVLFPNAGHLAVMLVVHIGVSGSPGHIRRTRGGEQLRCHAPKYHHDITIINDARSSAGIKSPDGFRLLQFLVMFAIEAMT